MQLEQQVVEVLIKEHKETHELVETYEQNGEPFITSYHIDTQAGLLLFSMMIGSKICNQ